MEREFRTSAAGASLALAALVLAAALATTPASNLQVGGTDGGSGALDGGLGLHHAWDDPSVYDPPQFERAMGRLASFQGETSTGLAKAGYSPSLRDTYHVVATLASIDRLGMVNASAVAQYVVSLFDGASGSFRDELVTIHEPRPYGEYEAKKYGYSACLATSYAVLTLDALGRLGALSAAERNLTADFLLACQSPASGGFLDDPSETDEPAELRNSYYAVEALKVLGRAGEVDAFALAGFVDALTYDGPYYFARGGYMNDLDPKFVTMEGRENSHETAYYAAALLDFCGELDEIDSTYWSNFLPYTYNSSSGAFSLLFDGLPMHTDNVGTGWALAELEITGRQDPVAASAYDLDAAANYLVAAFDGSAGRWQPGLEATSVDPYFSYAATFGLVETGRGGLLSGPVRDALAATLAGHLFQVDAGGKFGEAASSVPVTAGDLAATRAAVETLAATSDLVSADLERLYDGVVSCWRPDGMFDASPALRQSTTFYSEHLPLELSPTSLDGSVNRSRRARAGNVETGLALEALVRAGKLDEFGLHVHSLAALRDQLRADQFMNASSRLRGAFANEHGDMEGVNAGIIPAEDVVHFEATFWTVEALAALKAQITGQPLAFDQVTLDSNYVADVDALVSYVSSQARVDGQWFYFDPWDSDDDGPVVDTWKAVRVLSRVGRVDDVLTPLNRFRLERFLSARVANATLEELGAAAALVDALDLSADVAFSSLGNGEVERRCAASFSPVLEAFEKFHRADYDALAALAGHFRPLGAVLVDFSLPRDAVVGDVLEARAIPYDPWSGPLPVENATVEWSLGDPVAAVPEAGGEPGTVLALLLVPAREESLGTHDVTFTALLEGGSTVQRTSSVNVTANGWVDGTTLPANGSTLPLVRGCVALELSAGLLATNQSVVVDPTALATWTAEGTSSGASASGQGSFAGVSGGAPSYELLANLTDFQGETITLTVEVASALFPTAVVEGLYHVPEAVVELDASRLGRTTWVEGESTRVEVGARVVAGGASSPMDDEQGSLVVELRYEGNASGPVDLAPLGPDGGFFFFEGVLPLSGVPAGNASLVVTATSGWAGSVTLTFPVTVVAGTGAGGESGDPLGPGGGGSPGDDAGAGGGARGDVTLRWAGVVSLGAGLVGLVATSSWFRRRGLSARGPAVGSVKRD
ncbi:MAG: hypothetical protein Kow0069_05020 [Promethearchaeota archaeon]